MANKVWLLGAGINLVGSIGINLGTNLIKFHHLQNTKLTQPKNISRWFVTGSLLFTIGNVLNFISLAYGPISMLAALGSVQFLSNIVFSYFVLKLQITYRTVFATLGIVVGNVILVSGTDHDVKQYKIKELTEMYTEKPYRIYIVVCLALFVGLHLIYVQLRRKTSRLTFDEDQKSPMSLRALPFLYVAVSALLGTQSIILAKSCSQLIAVSLSGENQFKSYMTYLLLLFWAVAMGFWLVRMNSALKKFDAVLIIPLLQIQWTFFSIVGGGIYFQEFNGFSPLQYVLFCLGVATIFAAVHVLAPRKQSDNNRFGRDGPSRFYSVSFVEDDPLVKSPMNRSQSGDYSCIYTPVEDTYSLLNASEKPLLPTLRRSISVKSVFDAPANRVDRTSSLLVQTSGNSLPSKIIRSMTLPSGNTLTAQELTMIAEAMQPDPAANELLWTDSLNLGFGMSIPHFDEHRYAPSVVSPRGDTVIVSPPTNKTTNRLPSGAFV